MKTTPLLAAAGACALALAACGCGGSTGTVSGKVTYLGRPLPGGTVTCLTKENRPYLGKIEPDGSYTVSGVPAGPVTVAVEAGAAAGEPPVPLHEKDQPPPAMKPPASEPAPPPAMKLPKQYANPDSSGIGLTVVKGTNSFNIELK
jgi:hypothetical protein